MVKKLDGVCPLGDYTAWEYVDELKAVVVLRTSVVRTFRGETARADAIREAGDLNVKYGDRGHWIAGNPVRRLA